MVEVGHTPGSVSASHQRGGDKGHHRLNEQADGGLPDPDIEVVPLLSSYTTHSNRSQVSHRYQRITAPSSSMGRAMDTPPVSCVSWCVNEPLTIDVDGHK